MGIIISTSLIAAFVSGIAALLAPCCITVLLPSYLGSIFRERKTVFFMTFIFFLGILTVFLPLGLGMAALSQIFSKYHPYIFSFAGIFFLILAVMLLSGKKFMLPFSIHPKLEGRNAGSVYILGIFSGIATTCCAPVLAGVMAMSVLPGSVIWGLVYTLVYVLGMVLPLFVIAALVDGSKLTQKMISMRTKKISILGKNYFIRTTDLVAGFTFLIMGIITLRWAGKNDVITQSELQLKVNLFAAKSQKFITALGLPDWALTALFLGIFGLIIFFAVRTFKKSADKPR